MLKSCPGMFAFSAVVSIMNSICMGILIYLSQRLYDTLIYTINELTNKRDVIIAAIFFGGFTIVNQILNGLSVYIMNIIFNIIKRDLTYELHTKADRLCAISFENEKIYDQLQKALRGRDESIFLLFICFTPITCHLPLYLFIGSYLYTLRRSFVFAILLIFIPICISYYYKIKAKTMLVDNIATPARTMNYYYRCITGREFFKETRLLGAVSFFRNLYEHTMQLVNLNEVSFKTKNLKIDFIAKLITLVGYGYVLYMIFSSVISKIITIGAFAAVLNGIGLIFDEMKELVSDDIGANIGSVSSVKNLLNFLELSEEKTTRKQVNTEILIHGMIQFRDVSFKYPNSENFVLKDINLVIKPGEKLAIVGTNGSGKTTLTKLLLGFFQPSIGQILVNGQSNIQDVIRYNGLTSAIFQDFMRYKMTLRDNISISNISSELDNDLLYRVMRDAGISKELNPDTNISVEFGGIDLSGGQWQRIAIARGMYRKHNLIVLDEPTAAIDPIEESNIYQKFVDIIEDRTAILVTHRIGAARLADRILVMDKGQCIDSGSHQQLMERCKTYRIMYHAQADWYYEKNLK